jgi:glycosyltransferase involved in cell wall biosynthesis
MKEALDKILLCEGDKVRYFRLPRRRYPSNLWMIRKLVEQIESIQPDVVHFTGYYPWMYFGLRRLSTYPLVLTTHDPAKHSGDIESKIVPGSDRWFYKYMTKVIVMGAEMKKAVVSSGVVDNTSVDVILHGNGHEFLQYSDPTIGEQENTVLFFGRMYKYKGLEYLVDAEPIIRREIPNVRFVIAGKGSTNYLKNLKTRIVHPEVFQFINEYVPDSMVARLYQQASLVVLPYVDGTQSGPLLLSYSFRKPVVVTNVGSLPEYVLHGRTGYVVPAKDPNALAERIISLLKDGEVRREMGEEGYRMATERLSWETLAGEYLKVYEKACLNRKRVTVMSS